MQQKEVRILCLCDYGAVTGFATVSKNIFKHLKAFFGDRLQMNICAINYFGESYYEDENTFVFSAVKSAPVKDDFGRHGFLKILKEDMEGGGYDGIFIIQDLFTISPIIPLLKQIKQGKRLAKQKEFKSIFYFPIDNKMFFEDTIRDLGFFDELITYTQFGKQELLRVQPELCKKIKVIPHGNNNKEFYPVDQCEIAAFRKSFFGEENADKFIVTNVNRNQPRKDIPCTILGFKEYRERYNNPNALLYLNMNPKDPLGNDIRLIMRQINFEEYKDYMLPRKDLENHGIPTDVLNSIYNASDVFVTTTIGGGWELTVTEAFAAKLPVIAPNHTSLTEIGALNRLWYLNEFEYRVNADNQIRPTCFAKEVADRINDVYQDKATNSDRFKKRLANARQFVLQLDWKNVCQSWIEIFKKTYFK